MEELLRTHILASYNQRCDVTIKEAALELHHLIEDGHPNKELVLQVGEDLEREEKEKSRPSSSASL